MPQKLVLSSAVGGVISRRLYKQALPFLLSRVFVPLGSINEVFYWDLCKFSFLSQL